jgi:imidazolonepropionase
MTDLLITNISEVATPLGNGPLAGAEQGRVHRLDNAEILCRDGKIEFVGTKEERERQHGELESAERLDAADRAMVPGFVDPHTHLPWCGSREDEFVQRLAGVSYQEISAGGGGILSTVRSTREASEEELVSAVSKRMDQMLSWGTTTAEAKSGYGLNLVDEIKQLRAIRAADTAHAVDLMPTLLAAHEIPPEHRGERERYIDIVCEEITPAVAEAGLARFCDVFCEQGVFSAEESRRVLSAGTKAGLAPRLHADEFVDSGGAELAAELGALSADHLMAISPAGVDAMAAAGIIGILLPGTSFFLMKTNYAPARRLIEAGVPVALATDCNPGSSHTESMPMVLVLAVLQLGLTIGEALTAATLNAACSLGVGDRLGTIEVGKQADLTLLEAPNYLHLAYHYGINPVAMVIKRGRVVHQAG